MGAMRIWDSRQPVMKRALARYSEARLARLLAAAARTDRVVKHVESAPVWETITDLVLDLLAPAKRPQLA
jgi:DNA polymerase III delta subunit